MNNHAVHYTLSILNQAQHWIEVKAHFLSIKPSEKIEVRIPFWRPGRYEAGNFSKNILEIDFLNTLGEKLSYQKTGRECWTVVTDHATELMVRCVVYAGELNAGSSYAAKDQLYVNPVNMMPFINDLVNENIALKIDVPHNWQIACTLKQDSLEKNVFYASNFDELADSPFIASNALEHHQFEESGLIVHLWFKGCESSVDFEKLEADFRPFIADQLNMMGHLPIDSYHFIFQLLPDAFYHGVEHANSTVIALGPAISVFEQPMYDELLGVSSHEFFHAWNIKRIRPSEMLPYDFKSENYSRLGWIYEGITTWYGDYSLYRSGVFDTTRYLKTLNEKLKRHFLNYGRFRQAVSEASFDTWVDGYVAGVPHRKTSIYTEGSLVACMLNYLIQIHSNKANSLDDVMRILFKDASQGIGYSDARIKEIIRSLTVGLDIDSFFNSYIYGVESFESLLEQALLSDGFVIKTHKHYSELEHQLGCIFTQKDNHLFIHQVAPDSIADKVGLSAGLQMIAWNNYRISKDNYKKLILSDGINKLVYFKGNHLEEAEIILDGNQFYYLSKEVQKEG